MSEDSNIEKAPNVPPFVRFVASSIPCVFDDSLSYYEALCALWKWLQDNVVTVINNNATVTENYIEDTDDKISELTHFTEEIKNYVDNYFNNLDVQSEINNKLDAMVLDGTMDTIINQEIFGQINSDIADMKIDIQDLQTEVSGANDKVLFIGDSYLVGYNGSTNVNSWGYYFKQAAGLDNTNSKILAESGAGFVKEGGQDHTFLTLLQANIDNITNKDDYKNIIVGAGPNDQSHATVAELTTAIGNFATYAKEQFPNAKIYVGVIGGIKNVGTSTLASREKIWSITNQAVKASAQYGVNYLSGVNQVAHDYTNYGSDGIHFSQDGYQKLGYAMYESWSNGNYNHYVTEVTETIPIADGDVGTGSAGISFRHCMVGDMRYISIEAFNTSFTPVEITNASISLTANHALDETNILRNIIGTDPTFDVELMFTLSDDTTEYFKGNIYFDNAGKMLFTTRTEVRNKTYKAIRLWKKKQFVVPTVLS